MESKLTFKIELQYFLEDKKVIFHNEICNDGLTTKSISIGNNRVIEKTINDRVLSGECLVDGTTCGYTYIYDQFGTTIDLVQINKNISINESIYRINKIKNSEEFFKAKINGLLIITNSPQFISSPVKNFSSYKEITLTDNENTSIYLVQQNFMFNGKTSEIENEEECYQINNDYISFVTDLKNNTKNIYYNIDNIEIENADENTHIPKKALSIIEQLQPLKELLNSSPKNYNNLKIKTQKKIRHNI